MGYASERKPLAGLFHRLAPSPFQNLKENERAGPLELIRVQGSKNGTGLRRTECVAESDRNKFKPPHSAFRTSDSALKMVRPEAVAASPNRIKSPVPVFCGFERD